MKTTLAVFAVLLIGVSGGIVGTKAMAAPGKILSVPKRDVLVVRNGRYFVVRDTGTSRVYATMPAQVAKEIAVLELVCVCDMPNVYVQCGSSSNGAGGGAGSPNLYRDRVIAEAIVWQGEWEGEEEDWDGMVREAVSHGRR